MCNLGKNLPSFLFVMQVIFEVRRFTSSCMGSLQVVRVHLKCAGSLEFAQINLKNCMGSRSDLLESWLIESKS